jgi:hypothetical protein
MKWSLLAMRSVANSEGHLNASVEIRSELSFFLEEEPHLILWVRQAVESVVFFLTMGVD